jgi:glycosyltransferase involved in cell wall biosynthesis
MHSALSTPPHSQDTIWEAGTDEVQMNAKRRLRILYILPPTPTFAGIERVIDEVCAELARTCGDRFQIDVLYTSQYEGHDPKSRPYASIQARPRSRLGLMSAVRQTVRAKPYDLVVVPQVEATVVFWFACLGLNRKFILYIHGNPALEGRSAKARFLFMLMRRFLIGRLAAVFAISPKQMAYFKQAFPSKTPHFWVPNPVRRFRDRPFKKIADSGVTTFLNIGRFCYQKGQDILVRAFADVRSARPLARLRLVGYGAEKAQLETLISSLGLTGAVSLEYYPDEPSPALESSDIYVSSSRWEGWSLAICEALRFGLPVIATDCDFGPSDILVDERLGQLVKPDDEKALSAAMISACDNINAAREHARFRIDAIDRYSAENIVGDHAAALQAAAQRSRRAPTRQP